MCVFGNPRGSDWLNILFLIVRMTFKASPTLCAPYMLGRLGRSPSRHRFIVSFFAIILSSCLILDMPRCGHGLFQGKQPLLFRLAPWNRGGLERFFGHRFGNTSGDTWKVSQVLQASARGAEEADVLQGGCIRQSSYLYHTDEVAIVTHSFPYWWLARFPLITVYLESVYF